MHERLGFALQGVPLCSWSLLVHDCNKYNTTENKNPDSLCFVGVWVQGAITGYLIIILSQEIFCVAKGGRNSATPPSLHLCVYSAYSHFCLHVSICSACVHMFCLSAYWVCMSMHGYINLCSCVLHHGFAHMCLQRTVGVSSVWCSP